MELLRGELYKIFSWKIVYAALGIFIFINLLYFNSSTGFKSFRYIYDDYKGYEGRITQQVLDHADKLEAEYRQRHGDGSRSGRFDQMELSYYLDVKTVQGSIYDYQGTMESVQTKLDSLRSYKESYAYKEREMELEGIKKAGYLDEVRYVKGWQAIVQYNRWLGYFFIGILIIIGLAPVFSEEYSQRTDNILLSSRYGRTRLVTAKTAAGLIYCSLVVAVFSIIPLVFYWYTYGLYGFDAPLKQIYNFYSMTPFTMKIWQFYLIQRGYLLLGSFALGMMVMVISSLSTSTLVTAFAGGGVFLVPSLIDLFKANFNNIAYDRQFNYAGFIKLEHLFESYQGIFNFMRKPVRDEYVLLGLMCVLVLVSCMALYAIIKRREVS